MNSSLLLLLSCLLFVPAWTKKPNQTHKSKPDNIQNYQKKKTINNQLVAWDQIIPLGIHEDHYTKNWKLHQYHVDTIMAPMTVIMPVQQVDSLVFLVLLILLFCVWREFRFKFVRIDFKDNGFVGKNACFVVKNVSWFCTHLLAPRKCLSIIS